MNISRFCARLFFFLSVAALSSCSTVPRVQSQVNSLVAAGRFSQAVGVLDSHRQDGYGEKNRLLYFLDKGVALHFAGRYEESIKAFRQAKQIYSQLYTQSVTRLGGSWLWNDYALPYRGEDFERVLINVFQEVNYTMTGDLENALVEARDANNTLHAINLQYQAGQKNIYSDDAFARFLAGILYETEGTSADMNDAYISYSRAAQVYRGLYAKHYGFSGVPLVLKKNLLQTAALMGRQDLNRWQKEWPELSWIDFRKNSALAQIYLIHYNGLAPVKREGDLPVPLPGGYVSQIAFPRYETRPYNHGPFVFEAQDSAGHQFSTKDELAENIERIAIQGLHDRALRVLAKAVARPLGKYVLEKTAENRLEKKYGRNTGAVARLAASVYNLYSERADLRSWETLPAQIRIARLYVPAGTYTLRLNNAPVGQLTVKAGETRFLIVRTPY